MPSKLHLKRTPAEQAAHEFRKAQRAARKAAKKRHLTELSDDDESRSKKSRQSSHDGYVFDLSDGEYGPPPPPGPSDVNGAHKPDYDAIYAQMEEQRFREKMFGALEDDERLDAVESRLNDYAHVPRRWRGGGMDKMDDELGVNPQMMEDEDYAEWVRAGMWRKKHAAEHEEQLRKEKERAERRKREEAVREETRRLERAAESERRRRRKGKERQREADARAAYDAQWKQLLAATDTDDKMLAFSDVPWPVFDSRMAKPEDFTLEAVSAFLLPPTGADVDEEVARKERKDKLREAMLRFHPDKFEGRILALVRDKDKEKVKEAVGVVARILGELLGGGK